MGYVVWLVLMAICLVIGALIWKFAEEDSEARPWGMPMVVGAVVLTILGGLFSGFYIIDPGTIGVQVKFGKMLEETLPEGPALVNPFVKVHEMNGKLREVTEKVTVKTADNLDITVDVTFWVYLNMKKAQEVYRDVSSKDNDQLTRILQPAMRSSLRDEAAKYLWVDIYGKERESYKSGIFKSTSVTIGPKGFTLTNVLLRQITPPQKITDAVEKKLEAQQQKEQMVYQKEIEREKAEMKEIEANGIAKAQDIIQRKLTPLYVQWHAINSYEKLAESKNTTFIIMPTSTKGAGMPLILNAQAGK